MPRPSPPPHPQPRPTRDAPPGDLPARRLDSVVRALYRLSWSEARSRVTSGKVRVGDVVRTDPLFRVRDPSLVSLHMNAPRSRVPPLPDGAIVHVDTHVIVVDKPPGISTVPFDDEETGTLDDRVRNWLAHEDRRARRGGRPALGVVHRLDKETSGLLVFARTWLAKQSLTAQFRAHTVVRRYLAIATGNVGTQTFRSEIVQDRGDGLRGSRLRGRRGQDQGLRAVTHVTAIERLGGAATLVECRLETGRTHQIRIHLSEAGHPLVGEKVYIRDYRGALLAAPRMMLHAALLGFIHPSTEEDVRWERGAPPDFEEVLSSLRGAHR